MTLLVILGRYAIAEIFLGEAAAGRLRRLTGLAAPGRRRLSSSLDGVQTVAAGALRGINDTRLPLLFATISYWLIGFTFACLLGFRDARSALSASGSGYRPEPRPMLILLILRFAVSQS